MTVLHTATTRDRVEQVDHFEVLLPLLDEDQEGDPLQALDDGGASALPELRTHNGTVALEPARVRRGRRGGAPAPGEPRVARRPDRRRRRADALFFHGLVWTLARQDRTVWHDMSFGTAEANYAAGARRGIESVL